MSQSELAVAVADPRVVTPFWTQSVEATLVRLDTTREGLGAAEASRRLVVDGPNSDRSAKRIGVPRAISRRLLEPLSLILLAAGIVSAATGDAVGGSIIVAILALSVLLDTYQEGRATHAAEVLRQSVALSASVRRDGRFGAVAIDAVVPGDIVQVRAGDIIPADALFLDSNAFTANEAALTGEPYPVDKRGGTVTGTTAPEASNALFRGAVAQTGTATALVVGTGRNTLFGSAAAALATAQAPSPFERDLHAYGMLTTRLTLALVVIVLTASIFIGRPLLQSLLFAVALAVGLTPELLPMITTVTLSRGAVRMAKRKVIVKRLASIHDLGAMTILCTDKTGTLTSAEISLARSIAPTKVDDPEPARLGAIAAALGGDEGALGIALVAASPDAAKGWTLAAQSGFDFDRHLGSVLAVGSRGTILIVKGAPHRPAGMLRKPPKRPRAPEAVLAACATYRLNGGAALFDDAARNVMIAQVRALAEQGLRTIAIASRPWTGTAHPPKPNDEADLIYEGLCAFADSPKPTAHAAVARLKAAGIRLKILSGDDPVVVGRLAGLIGLTTGNVLSGADIAKLSDDALAVQVRNVDAYGRLTPDQKARLVRALQAGGAVVGYLGDGINDAPALKLADIGLSVPGAAAVAQASADMIMLDSDLGVVADGVEEGRRTFANILKYVRMGASSNFGNMLSMAAASLFLPFLPMLPTQILLNNLLYDISEIGIPFDGVRPEAVARPQVWDMKGLIRFAAVMGPLSSVFDLLTFAGLSLVFHVAPPTFRTAWFLESMATQILVIFIIRTNGRPWADLPRPALALSSLGALVVAMVLPFTRVGAWFGFAAPSLTVAVSLAVLTLGYLAMAQLLKTFLFDHRGSPLSRHRRV